MKRSTLWPRSTPPPPDRDHTPYWDTLADAERPNARADVFRWLHQAERARSSRYAYATWWSSLHPPLRLALAALVLTVSAVACTVPVAHEAPYGTLVTGTLPLPPEAAQAHLLAVPGVTPLLLTTTAVLDPWHTDAATAFAIVLDGQAPAADAIRQDIEALGSPAVHLQTLTEPRTTPVYQLVLRALPGRRDTPLTEADRAAQQTRLEAALAVHREALAAQHLTPAFIVDPEGTTDLTWADTPTPTTIDDAVGALQTVQPFLHDALGPEAVIALAQRTLPDATPEALQPLVDLAQQLYTDQNVEGQTRLLALLRAEIEADGTLTAEDLSRIVDRFE